MKSILVVDSEKSLRELLSEHLVKHNYKCRTASDAEQAVTLMLHDGFDVVITGLSMPGVSGIDLCRFVRMTYPETVVVVTVGASDFKYTSEAVRLGVFSCLMKPFELSQVDEVINRAVRHQDIVSGKQAAQFAQ